jgi:predicted protein tyrosine phosphatase
MLKPLFVCSAARNRSFTARNLAILGGCLAECAGSDSSARLQITSGILRDADVIICFEKHHAQTIRELPGSEGKVIHILNIEDIYNPFDSELVFAINNRLKVIGLDQIAGAITHGFNQFQLMNTRNSNG